MALTRFLEKFVLRRMARARGFMDPMELVSRLNRFSQPSEVLAPTELLRAGAVMHARGLLNSQAIQHNLDWIWPYWVEKQFDPKDSSFIPRAFSLTHINLTHRNWTAVGLPDKSEMPIVDPRGLLTPFWGEWSIDSWLTFESKEDLIPSKTDQVTQKLNLDDNNSVVTEFQRGNDFLQSKVELVPVDGRLLCRMTVTGRADCDASLVVSVRPSNPEGVSLIRKIEILENNGFQVNGDHAVYFDTKADAVHLSNYKGGDVYFNKSDRSDQGKVRCEVEMASAAMCYTLKTNEQRSVTVDIPLTRPRTKESRETFPSADADHWENFLADKCEISVPKDSYEFLFDAAHRTLLMHTAEEVYAGPYTYRRFWFRDAVYIAYALLCLNHTQRVERIIDSFLKRITPGGYCESQQGEWDSNGQVLWLIGQYCRMTNSKPKDKWYNAVKKAAGWIIKKRLSKNGDRLHEGLLPAGFSAEHFGPNDYYYWDDFWSIAGLKEAGRLAGLMGDEAGQSLYRDEAEDLDNCVRRSLEKIRERIGRDAMPSSPHRRLDSACIGSLAAGYPLFLWPGDNKQLLDTVDYLYDNNLVHGALFHDMSHSGINPYLTLHMAQVYLRAGDKRYAHLLEAIAQLASPTGQWPEAVHPITRGGCMGDGQHVWAAAEWLLMMKNCFVYEETQQKKLVLTSGLLDWIDNNKMEASIGPVRTTFGKITVQVKKDGKKIFVSWSGDWHGEIPEVVNGLRDCDVISWDTANQQGELFFQK